MKETRWRTFGHMLRLALQTPCQQTMDSYFQVPVNAKRYSGNQRRTLPVILHYGIVQGNSKHDLEINQSHTIEDLTKLRRIPKDRDKWKELTNMICSIA